VILKSPDSGGHDDGIAAIELPAAERVSTVKSSRLVQGIILELLSRKLRNECR
jgi:hypothetical protein